MPSLNAPCGIGVSDSSLEISTFKSTGEETTNRDLSETNELLQSRKHFRNPELGV
jgi:hypothetical protein